MFIIIFCLFVKQPHFRDAIVSSNSGGGVEDILAMCGCTVRAAITLK